MTVAPSTKKRAVATIGSGPMAPVMEQALRTIRPFAERYGYELVIGDGDSAGRPPAWAKVLLLQRLIEQYEEVLWLDSDLVVLDASEDIARHVATDDFQALVGEGRNLNTGVWFMRSSPEAKQFLRAVWDSTQYIEHQIWENAAVMALLGWDPDTAADGAPTPWSEKTTTLPYTWNSVVFALGLRASRIRHYAATSNELRERWMRADADRVENNPRWLVGAGRRWIDRHAMSPLTLIPRLRARTMRARGHY